MAGSVAGIIATLIMAGGATALRMGTQGSPGMAAKVAMAASPGMVVGAGGVAGGVGGGGWCRQPAGGGRQGAPPAAVVAPAHQGGGARPSQNTRGYPHG